MNLWTVQRALCRASPVTPLSSSMLTWLICKMEFELKVCQSVFQLGMIDLCKIFKKK